MGYISTLSYPIKDIDEKNGEELSSVCKTEGKENNGTFMFVKFDASKADDCKRLVDKAMESFGRIDVVFNNVGIQPKESSKYRFDVIN